MIRPLLMAWGVVFAVVALWVTWRLSTASQAWEVAQQAVTSTVEQVQRLRHLRQHHAAPSLGPRPDGDLVSRAQRALEEAGLPTAAFSGLQPRETQQSATGNWRIQRVQLKLVGLGVVQFGGWLRSWQAQVQPWSVESVEFARQQLNVDQASVSADPGVYEVTLELSAPFVDEP